MEYTVIGLDTSSTASGFAIYQNGFYIRSGTVNLRKAKMDDEARIKTMVLSLLQILNQYQPQTIVIEMTVVPRNAKTQRLLSEVVGAMRGWAYLHQTEFVEYRPSVWRKLICGESKIPKTRDECKAWSVAMVSQWKKDIDDNEADAVLIGAARFQEMLGKMPNFQE